MLEKKHEFLYLNVEILWRVILENTKWLLGQGSFRSATSWWLQRFSSLKTPLQLAKDGIYEELDQKVYEKNFLSLEVGGCGGSPLDYLVTRCFALPNMFFFPWISRKHLPETPGNWLYIYIIPSSKLISNDGKLMFFLFRNGGFLKGGYPQIHPFY